MIKHIVCFKLKDNSLEKKEEAKKVLMSMKDNVPLIHSMNVGIDFLGSSRSYDVILEVILSSKEDLEKYQINQEEFKITEFEKYVVIENK